MTAAQIPPHVLEMALRTAHMNGHPEQAVSLIEEHWVRLMFAPATTALLFEVLGHTRADYLAEAPRAGLIAEVIGGLPPGTTRWSLPTGEDDIAAAIRDGDGRRSVEISILAMIAERVRARPGVAVEVATSSRPLLQATSTTRFSPATDLVAYWHLQAAQAALHAGDLTRAQLDFEHAWAHRDTDVTGYVAASTAPFAVLLAALSGDHRELGRWQREWAAISTHAATLTDAETIARPALIADLLISTDHLADDVASNLVDALAPQLPYDELWPLTLWTIVRHLCDTGDLERARQLTGTLLDRHPAAATNGGLRGIFAALAQAEIALAAGDLATTLPYLEAAKFAVLPGLNLLYAACLHLRAGDVAEARRQGVLAERIAIHPRVLREARYLLALCDLSPSATPISSAAEAHFDLDLRRVVAHLPQDLHANARVLSGSRAPASRVSAPARSEALIHLTPAEDRALHALAAEGSLAHIAEQLSLSRNTLKAQAHSLYRKFNVTSRQELIAVARRHGHLPEQ